MGTPLRRAGHDRGARMVERAIVAVSVVGLLVMLATAPQWGAWVDGDRTECTSRVAVDTR